MSMIRPEEIRTAVTAYLGRYPDEVGRLTALTAALAAPDDLTSRKTFTGHVTCSAIVCDPAGRVLHIRHNALNAWLRPGGHLEPDDTTLTGAVVREVAEETGIAPAALVLVDDVPLDIDVHPIPANPVKGEPDHQHFDLRYAFTTTPQDVALQAEEVHDFAWLPAAEVEPTWLTERIAAVASPA
jgi:8-oxo-dGTP pyrophosphatase MutT (NUDIX family)